MRFLFRIKHFLINFFKPKQLPPVLVYCGDSCKRSFDHWLTKEPKALNFAILSAQMGRCAFCSEKKNPKKLINIV